MNEIEIRGSFETRVSFELMYKTVWAWIRGARLKHNDVLIVLIVKTDTPHE